MGKPDRPSRLSGEDKSGIDAHVFDEGQPLDLQNDDVGGEAYAEDVQFAGIDIVISKMKNKL